MPTKRTRKPKSPKKLTKAEREAAKRRALEEKADNFDPKAYIMSLPDADVVKMDPPFYKPEQSVSLVERLKVGDAFFYPSSGFDWFPLSRFSDRCSVFIYCDYFKKLQDFTAAVSSIHTGTPDRNTLRCEAIHELTPAELGCSSTGAPPSFLTRAELEAYQRCYRRVGSPQGWGRKVDVLVNVDGNERRVVLIFLCADGVATYLKLFNEQKQAPRFLCIKCCGDGFGFNWTNYNDWSEPLGRAVLANLRDNRKAPDYLITDREHDWPWSVAVHQFVDWDDRPTLYVRPEHPDAKGASIKTSVEQVSGSGDIKKKRQPKFPNPFCPTRPGLPTTPKS